MGAEKLILFTNTNGVYENKKLRRTLTITDSKNLIHKGVAEGGMRVKLENCIDAIERGVKRVHIVNGLSPHSLLKEILTKKGVGTMIIADKESEAYFNE